MKLYLQICAASLAVVSCMCFAACGNEKKNEAQLPSEPQYTDVSSAVPDEFFFPGEAVGSGADAESDANAYNMKTVDGIVSYLSEFTDLTKYTETAAEDDEGCSVCYSRSNEEKTALLTDSPVILLGGEKTEVTLPSDIASLSDIGFTVLGDVNGETEVNPGETKMITLCTPETSEIFGFSCTNVTSEKKRVSELTVDRLIITSFNNFTFASDISGTSDIRKITEVLGEPDIIAVTVKSEERSVVLEYSFADLSLMVLADGDTKGMIAIDITAEG